MGLLKKQEKYIVKGTKIYKGTYFFCSFSAYQGIFKIIINAILRKVDFFIISMIFITYLYVMLVLDSDIKAFNSYMQQPNTQFIFHT